MIAAIGRFRGLKKADPPPRRGYDAFISYSRGASEPLADALERGLELIARPWYRVGGLRIFRDRTGLGATSDLRTMLFDHVRASNFLVLIASKGAAASPWVDQELRHWFDTLKRPADKAVVVLHDGDMPRWDSAKGEFDLATTSSLPPTYLRNCRLEPAFVDMRWIDQTKPPPTLKDAKFLDQIADIATPLLGKASKDEVISDEIKRRKNVRSVIAAAALLLVALAGASYWLYDTRAHITRSEAWAKRAGELNRNNPDQALLFALAAADAYPTDNSTRALISATFRSAGLAGIAHGHTKPIATLQFVGPLSLVSADEKGEVRKWGIDPQGGVKESRSALSLGYVFPKDDSTDRVPNVKTTVVVPPNGQWVLAVNSAESSEDTISESRAEIIGLAGTPPPLPPDLADSFGYMKDTINVSPDGKRLTYFGGIDQFKRWTVGSDAPAKTATGTERCYNHRVMSRDSSTVVCEGFVGEPMPIWDLAENRIIGEVPMAEGEGVDTMAASDDGSVLAKAVEGRLRVAPLRPRALIKDQTIPLAGRISALAFSPSGKLLAVALYTGRLLVLSLAGGEFQQAASFDLGDTTTTSLAFSHDDLTVAAGTRSGAIEIWTLGGRAAPLTQLTGSRTPAGLSVSEDESRVAIASSAGDIVKVETRDLQSGKLIGEPLEFRMPILGLGFAGDQLRVIGKGPEGERCLSVGSLSTMIIATVNATNGRPAEVIAPAERCDLTGAQLAPKGVITVAENGVALWREDTHAWTEIWNQPQTLYTNPELTASGDGTRVAFVPRRPWDNDALIKVEVWGLLAGEPRLIASLGQTTHQISILMSGDGSVLAVRTDARIDLWRIDAKDAVTALGFVDVGQDDGPAALNKTGSRLAISRQTGAINLWETRGPRLFATIPAPPDPTPTSFVAYPGHYLIVVGKDGTTRRLDTQPETWVRQACALTAQLRASGGAANLLEKEMPPKACASTAR
jgi:WD40 repeat protein